MFDPLGYATIIHSLGECLPALRCGVNLKDCGCWCCNGTLVAVTYTGGSASWVCEK